MPAKFDLSFSSPFPTVVAEQCASITNSITHRILWYSRSSVARGITSCQTDDVASCTQGMGHRPTSGFLVAQALELCAISHTPYAQAGIGWFCTHLFETQCCCCGARFIFALINARQQTSPCLLFIYLHRNAGHVTGMTCTLYHSVTSTLHPPFMQSQPDHTIASKAQGTQPVESRLPDFKSVPVSSC